jgi:hypothetical protein
VERRARDSSAAGAFAGRAKAQAQTRTKKGRWLLPPAQLACVKRPGEERIAKNPSRRWTGGQDRCLGGLCRRCRNEIQFRSDHPCFIWPSPRVRWSAVVAFGRNLHGNGPRTHPLISRYGGLASRATIRHVDQPFCDRVHILPKPGRLRRQGYGLVTQTSSPQRRTGI